MFVSSSVYTWADVVGICVVGRATVQKFWCLLFLVLATVTFSFLYSS